MPKWCARGPTWSVVAGLPPTSMPRFSASNRPTPIIGRRELQLTRRAALAAAQPRLEAIDTEKQEVRAALAQAVADRDLAKPNLGFTELRAPIDGMVGNRSAHRSVCHGGCPADLAGAGARPLGGRQLQGEPARPNPSGTGGLDRGRCTAWTGVSRARRQPGAGDRRAVQRAAAGKTLPAISPRSCSGSPSASCSTAPLRNWVVCGPDCR